tara:strand:- start:15 stop:494 length:480 start_codon:yes stop_codon:yes gene_type:complete
MQNDDSFTLDKVDIEILRRLQENARMPYQDIADELRISAGTVHGRLAKMKEAGVITGSKFTVDPRRIGLEVTTFIGVNLRSANDLKKTIEIMRSFEEVVEVHYTTGQYGLFVKVMVESTKALHSFLLNKLQTIPEIHSTETFVSLDNPIQREGKLPLAK